MRKSCNKTYFQIINIAYATHTYESTARFTKSQHRDFHGYVAQISLTAMPAADDRRVAKRRIDLPPRHKSAQTQEERQEVHRVTSKRLSFINVAATPCVRTQLEERQAVTLPARTCARRFYKRINDADCGLRQNHKIGGWPIGEPLPIHAAALKRRYRALLKPIELLSQEAPENGAQTSRGDVSSSTATVFCTVE